MAGKERLNYSSAVLLDTAITSGITSPKELANLMGNADVETRGFSVMHEDLGYRSVRSILNATSSADKRFTLRQIESAVASKDPARIAEILYERRLDLGNTEVGDGWRFHGRGYFQYTGRDNYARFGQKYGVDLIRNPDLAAEPATASKLALAYWQERVPARFREDVQAAAMIINGGTNGMDARLAASKKWETLLTPSLIQGFAAGRLTAASFRDLSAPEQRATHEEPPLRSAARLDETGYRVHEIQRTLATLGYHDLKGDVLGADGFFGPNTRHAVKSFQRAHGLHVDGIVGEHTLAALENAQRWPLLSEATHPHHTLYDQVAQGIHRVPQLHGKKDLDNAAVALAVAADAAGMRCIDHVVLGSDGVNLFAVQGRLDDPAHRRVHVELAHAMAHPAEHHSMSMAPAHLHAVAAQQQAVQQRGPVMMGP